MTPPLSVTRNRLIVAALRLAALQMQEETGSSYADADQDAAEQDLDDAALELLSAKHPDLQLDG